MDAALKTIDRIARVKGKLVDYSIQAVTIGKDAQGEVSLRVAFGKDDIVSGKAASTDIVQASAAAYLNCVNRFLMSNNPVKKGK